MCAAHVGAGGSGVGWGGLTSPVGGVTGGTRRLAASGSAAGQCGGQTITADQGSAAPLFQCACVCQRRKRKVEFDTLWPSVFVFLIGVWLVVGNTGPPPLFIINAVQLVGQEPCRPPGPSLPSALVLNNDVTHVAGETERKVTSLLFVLPARDKTKRQNEEDSNCGKYFTS